MHSLSPLLMERISSAVAVALRTGDPINVIQIAERVLFENASENVALEDIESAVLDRAQATGRPIIFESTASSALATPYRAKPLRISIPIIEGPHCHRGGRTKVQSKAR
ncbi:hypothetical protein C8K44_1321 [Aminobacter sp. AP02]|nr:hypothetical protein C8K44_1321 [Aminobacter sp. AP02]